MSCQSLFQEKVCFRGVFKHKYMYLATGTFIW